MIATKFLGVFILSSIVLIESQVCPGTNTWECSNGTCIWYISRCDGNVHCDGSDEQNCGNWTCFATWLKCDDGLQCIWQQKVCDGKTDCDDGSDEQNCGSQGCQTYEWTCSDGDCIRPQEVCDGVVHCDGSDERNCGNYTCLPGYSKCEDGLQCVHTSTSRCSGFQECNDGSDEKNCANYTCPSYLWACMDGLRCVFLHVRCDGNADCVDGSDELYCGKPVVESLTLDGHNDSLTITKGDCNKTVTLNCTASGQVKGKFTIKKESDYFRNVIFRSADIQSRRLDTWTYEAVLRLSGVTTEDTGRYTCTVGENSRNTSKSIQMSVTCCKDGTYGVRCQESCGHCANDQPCDKKTGHCLACRGGWLLPLCKQGCKNKTYGAGCQELCGHCAVNEPCDASTGHCLACLDGWLPPLCKQGCENKTYGARCRESCGQCADNETCDASTGHCLACLDGWLPPLCNEACENKTYGARCRESCGQCANDQPCNASTGHCLACLDDWLPPFCDEGAPTDTTHSNMEIIAIGVGVGVPAFAAVAASLFHAAQFMSNIAWIPVISFGSKKAYQEEETDEGGAEEGGKEEEEEKEEEEDEVADYERENLPVDLPPDVSYETENETAQINNKQKFTKQYFSTARWLEDPYGDSKPATWHDFYSRDVDMNKGTQRSSEFTLHPDEFVENETDAKKENDS